MHIPSLIEKKRDGGTLDAEEIGAVVREFTAGTLPDYQMSALAMAIFFRGMSGAETTALTMAMLDSGRRLHWPNGHPPVVDKHSTGGIGDKVSLILAPLLACDGLWVPMISGRGLGITGGTLDKLESIPGFRVGLSEDEILAQIGRLGVAMVGQTPEICPADKRLYALRDVSGTVPSQPLIVASIMSKKLAESLDRLVLDVKFGSGAFMKTRPEAESLAAAMVEVGQRMGVAVSARLTPMDEPLGEAVGNALEVEECLETLQGSGPPDLVNLTLDLAAEVAHSPRQTLAGWLGDGTAWRKFQAMVEAQGGDLVAFAAREPAPVIRPVIADQPGTLRAFDAGTVGRAALALGAGRARATDSVDHRVGFSSIVKTGTPVAGGDALCVIHARSEADADDAERAIRAAVRIE